MSILPTTFRHYVSACLLGAAATLACANPLGYDDARHLLNRTGFSASESEVQSFAGLTREQAASRLLDGATTSAVIPPPAWIDEPIVPPRDLKNMSEDERKAFRRDLIEKGLDLRQWWLHEMLATPSPLTEKMTLFWHNHFVSSQQKVKYNQLMYRQNVLLRRNALGSYAAMLHEVARDPAMVIYLDSASNRKGEPNENFAREVMELFALGEGHYTEQDIKETARAFTGWSLDRETGQFMFRPRLHDDGVKTVLGRTGRLDGDDVLDQLLKQPATAEFIVNKFWREFISATPDQAEVRRFAATFRGSGYQVKPLLFAMLTSNAFYAPQNRGVLVKSPVELLVGTLKQFDVQTDDLRPVAVASAALGQNLFSPPNVKGWPGGDAWINSTTLLGRKQFLDRLFRNSGEFVETAAPAMPAGGDIKLRLGMVRGLNALNFDAETWFASAPASRERTEKLLLATAPEHAPADRQSSIAWLRSIVLDPVYQLK